MLGRSVSKVTRSGHVLTRTSGRRWLLRCLFSRTLISLFLVISQTQSQSPQKRTYRGSLTHTSQEPRPPQNGTLAHVQLCVYLARLLRGISKDVQISAVYKCGFTEQKCIIRNTRLTDISCKMTSKKAETMICNSRNTLNSVFVISVDN